MYLRRILLSSKLLSLFKACHCSRPELHPCRRTWCAPQHGWLHDDDLVVDRRGAWSGRRGWRFWSRSERRPAWNRDSIPMLRTALEPWMRDRRLRQVLDPQLGDPPLGQPLAGVRSIEIGTPIARDAENYYPCNVCQWQFVRTERRLPATKISSSSGSFHKSLNHSAMFFSITVSFNSANSSKQSLRYLCKRKALPRWVYRWCRLIKENLISRIAITTFIKFASIYFTAIFLYIFRC